MPTNATIPNITNDETKAVFVLDDVRSGTKVMAKITAVLHRKDEGYESTNNTNQLTSINNLIFFATSLNERFSLNSNQNTSQVKTLA